ncbi:TetR/AcrR family transcriptional regulator [Oceanobacter mangrovi]|uniref:TetR/AcrR family transcriptional regulator n=1 Tax=Oceanobacter mangrovi TaxID=2862510 RepID=UPI0031BA08B5
MKEDRAKTSRDDWVDAAYEMLIGAGVDAVKVVPLAKKMKTSRTSFYWLFKDRDEVLAALLERWQQQNTPALLKQAGLYAADAVEGMLNVFDCWLDQQLFDSELEYAIRSWSLQEEQVSTAVKEADEVRLAALREMFERLGFVGLEADTRARTVYLLQIGYISMHIEEEAGARLARIPEYVNIFTGKPCRKSDLERFASRHRNQFGDVELQAVLAGLE